MKIKENDGTIIDIYAIYWIKSLQYDHVDTYVYGLCRQNGGLSVYRLGDDVEIIDSTLSGDFIYYEEGIFYKPLIEENLLDDLLEYDETAYKRFLKIIKAEGLVDPDFY